MVGLSYRSGNAGPLTKRPVLAPSYAFFRQVIVLTHIVFRSRTRLLQLSP